MPEVMDQLENFLMIRLLIAVPVAASKLYVYVKRWIVLHVIFKPKSDMFYLLLFFSIVNSVLIGILPHVFKMKPLITQILLAYTKKMNNIHKDIYIYI